MVRSRRDIGHVAAHDTLRQALGNGGFAHARFTDQHGVVLALAAQDANDVADLAVTADDGIQLMLARQLGQIAAVFLERVVGILRANRW